MSNALKDIISFWFGTRDNTPDLQPQAFWFKSTPEIDADMRTRFLPLYDDIYAGSFDQSASTADDYLAMIIALDQLPRNMFRGTPQAFASDHKALELAKKALSQDFDQHQVSAHRRVFFYMPFEHSENLDDQNLSVKLFEKLGYDDYTRFAIAHRDVIEKYGRFPHRNAILGRESTPNEQDYLSKPGAGF